MDELAEENDWHREDERHPKPPAEHLFVARVVRVGAVVLVWTSLVNVRTAVVLCFSVVSVFGFGLAVLVLCVFVRVFEFCGGLIRRSVGFVLRVVGMLFG
nr:hypothetical protein [Halogranum amylolyticum]